MSAVTAFERMAHGVDLGQPFRIELPQGRRVDRGTGEPVFILHLPCPDVVSEIMTRGSLGFGEAYSCGKIDVEGDFQQMVRFGHILFENGLRPSWPQQLAILLGSLRRRNTLSGSKRNIAAHYDLGNEFYELFLDERLQYTCAYFETPDDSLEQAQLQKLDLVCRKLRLEPGMRVVEAGCGWGGLALHMASHYGVSVTAYNISKAQVAYARAKAEREGVPEDRLRYVLDDYRSIARETRPFDRFVSVGMLEHVGRENYRGFFDLVRRATVRDGVVLIHTIGRDCPTATDPWLEKHIFPAPAQELAPFTVLRALPLADIKEADARAELLLVGVACQQRSVAWVDPGDHMQ